MSLNSFALLEDKDAAESPHSNVVPDDGYFNTCPAEPALLSNT